MTASDKEKSGWPAAYQTVSKHQIRPPRIFMYIDAVVRSGSIRKAAEMLHMASSALNRRILDLEEELGEDLFERLPRGVRLTAAGELFVAYVRRSIGDLETVSSQIGRLKGLVRGQVRIAAAESVMGDLLPRAISVFQVSHPGVKFHISSGAPRELLAALIEDETDIVLAHDLPDHRAVSVIETARQTFCALVPPTHPLAGKAALRLRDCQPYPIALGDETLSGRALIDRVLAKTSTRLDPALISNSIEAMKAYARMSNAICFQYSVGSQRDTAVGELVAIPVVDPGFANAQLVLAMRRERILPVAPATFAEYLRTVLAAL